MEKNFKNKTLRIFLIGLTFGIYWWVIRGTDFSLLGFIEGFPYMADFLIRMVPPDFSILPRAVTAAVETVQIAILGTTLAVFFAFPLGFLAARNMTYRLGVYTVFRTVSNICRGVSEIVWALLFVAMVGLGPFPGVLALTMHSIGALSKFFSEALENIHEETISALRTTGASRIQVVFQGIIPEVLPHFVTYVLYYLEHNIRAATVLGIVGAGGIGFELLTSVKLFKYREVLTIILVMLLLVTLVDRLSGLVRRKVIGGK
jgi:phosphonate transport system permease protein